MGIPKGYKQSDEHRAKCRARAKPLADRFWPKVQINGPDDCWPWLASVHGGGYGQVSSGGRGGTMLTAHRVAWELTRGPIPEGLVVDHLCNNRRCCNPDHLKPCTDRENVLRSNAPSALAARRNHCKHGHPWTEQNIRWYRGYRRCLACETAYNKVYKSTHQRRSRAKVRSPRR